MPQWALNVITTIHVIVSIFLVFVVLIQSGKSADLAGMFGGMGSQTTFGPRGSATVLTRATTWSAVIFMLTSLTLSIAGSRKGTNSLIENLKNTPTQSQPVKK